MKLPELKENQKKKLIERFKQNKFFTEAVSKDIMTYQDYFKKFKCITNAEDGLLPFEKAAIQDAFKNKDPDFKGISEEMLIAVEVLDAIYLRK